MKWDAYSDHLRGMLHEMMKSEELTDVTLVCDDKIQFNAHKIILSGCSSVFKSIMKDLPHGSSVIYLRGIQHQEMESILEFIYLGVATFSKERMNEFLRVAHNLEIKDISKCVEFEDEKVPNHTPEEPVDEKSVQIPNSNPGVLDELVNQESKSESLDFNDENVPSPNSEVPKEPEENQMDHSECGCEDQNCADDQLMNTNIIKDNKADSATSDKQVTQASDDKFFSYQCNSKFTIKQDLRQHDDGIIYACNQCENVCKKTEYKAAAREVLNANIKLRHDVCKECEYKAGKQQIFNKHAKLKHDVDFADSKEPASSESQMPIETGNEEGSQNHDRKEIIYSAKITCAQCEIQLPSRQALYRHNKSKHNHVQYECEKCNFFTSRQDHLKRHIQSKHDGVKYECNLCDYNTTRQDHLKRHVQSKHEDTLNAAELKWTDVIETEPEYDDSFKNHAKDPLQNTNSRLDKTLIKCDEDGFFSCYLCESQFTLKHSLIRHIESKHEGITYSCNQCDSHFTLKHVLQNHIKAKHEDAKFECEKCDYVASLQSHLKRHIQSVHEGIRYSCNHCKQEFSQQGHLKTHIKTKHEGIKYQCDECDYQANWKATLKAHIESIHQNIKYPCHLCYYKATTRGSLKDHVRWQHEQ